MFGSDFVARFILFIFSRCCFSFAFLCSLLTPSLVLIFTMFNLTISVASSILPFFICRVLVFLLSCKLFCAVPIYALFTMVNWFRLLAYILDLLSDVSAYTATMGTAGTLSDETDG